MNSKSNYPVKPKTDMNEKQMNTSGKSTLSPIRAFVILVASIFLIELLIMFVFLFIPPLPDLAASFIDATALTLLVAPILYRFGIMPLYEHIENLGKLTASLEELNNSLEQHVAQRTRELAETGKQAEKRAAQLQIVSNVARTIASVQDIDTLLPTITKFVSDKFGFYHAGIFLMDSANEFAVFQASNSEGGEKMLKRGHKLKADSSSIVGFVVSRGEARVAVDVGNDSIYFNNPDLPSTRSELALPLNISGNVIGALDVQSTQADAFTRDDIATLTILADQIAIAIENTRLFSETRVALNKSEETISHYIKQEWQGFAQQSTNTGFMFDGLRTSPLENKVKPEKVKSLSQTGRLSLEKEMTELTVPIKFRGQTVGVLDVKSKKGSRQWTQDEITLLESAAERAAFALDNARLVESAQRRAARERAIGEISAKIGSVSDLDAIMQTAVEELGRKIGSVAEVTIELDIEET